MTSNAQRQAVEAAETYLAGIAARFDEALSVDWVVYYSAAEVSFEETALKHADLIVTGSHGCVADEVLRRSPVPVVLVPAACDHT